MWRKMFVSPDPKGSEHFECGFHSFIKLWDWVGKWNEAYSFFLSHFRAGAKKEKGVRRKRFVSITLKRVDHFYTFRVKGVKGVKDLFDSGTD